MERFWENSVEEVFTQLNARVEGLSAAEAAARLQWYGFNTLTPKRRAKGIWLLLDQFKSPLILLLVGAAVMSFFLKDHLNALIIGAIVLISGLLGFFQERGALNALDQVMQLVAQKTRVRRGSQESEEISEMLVPGDIILLSAGDLVPADCLIVEAKHLFANEASLTGESAPVEKSSGPSEQRSNALFLGTMVASGTAVALVVATGRATQYGALLEGLRFRPPETAFEVGVRKFGFFLLEVTLLLVFAIFALNIYFGRPLLETLLFSLALAVGLTPQLLPAIISVNLSHGARKMAAKKVLIKRLASIENFGQMQILCSDKTGTLTRGEMCLEKAVNVRGEKCDQCHLFGVLNAYFQAGYTNPLDQAILKSSKEDVSGWEKIDEIPYDFNRRRLSVVLRKEGKTVLISKGALPQILSICSPVANPQELERYFEESSRQGLRTLALAYGDTEEEKNLTFLGFLQFSDPIKEGAAEAVAELKRKGVHLKIITGDHHLVALHAAQGIGMTHSHLITGTEIDRLDEAGLMHAAREKNLFAEIVPRQKERIILALRKVGYTVGYLGDGINDVGALHSADVGIAVQEGAEAAREAADIVLLNKDLHVLRAGVEEGRRTFANTIKYVYMATSANFGNMFSMAGASLFLSFLPLLPKQVLLTNLLTDLPEMAIATDRVDEELVRCPVKWDLAFIRKFMVVFGLISSIFDYATFAVLAFYLKAEPDLFRTGWFVESVASAAFIVLIIRTRRFSLSSRPSWLLGGAVVGVVAAVLVLSVTPGFEIFGFVPLPFAFFPPLAAILGLYFISAEVAKRVFFRRQNGNHVREGDGSFKGDKAK